MVRNLARLQREDDEGEPIQAPSTPLRQPGRQSAVAPYVDAHLLTHLRETFARKPSRTMTLPDFYASAGHAEVFDHLEALLKAQENVST